MAFTSTVSTASIRLANVLALQERVTFDDIEGDPSTTVNWMSNAVLNDLDLKTGAGSGSGTVTNPQETSVTQVWGQLITASGTSHTLDLSALPRDACLSALDLTGLKVQGFLLQAPFANTDPVIMVPGAANGYNIQNNASASIQVAPGGVEVSFYPEASTGDAMPDVAVADAEIDFSSAMTNFQIFIAIWAG